MNGDPHFSISPAWVPGPNAFTPREQTQQQGTLALLVKETVNPNRTHCASGSWATSEWLSQGLQEPFPGKRQILHWIQVTGGAGDANKMKLLTLSLCFSIIADFVHIERFLSIHITNSSFFSKPFSFLRTFAFLKPLTVIFFSFPTQY